MRRRYYVFVNKLLRITLEEQEDYIDEFIEAYKILVDEVGEIEERVEE